MNTWLLLSLLCCRYHPGSDSTESPEPRDTDQDAGPGLLRLGPPAPSVGVYGIAADPAGDEIFVGNLHVPFITIVDPATGAWTDAIDVRQAGASRSFFPRLAIADGVLLATDTSQSTIWRYDTETHWPLEALVIKDQLVSLTVHDDAIWVLTGSQVQRYEGVEQTLALEIIGEPTTNLAVDDERIAVVSQPSGAVTLFDHEGNEIWRTLLKDAYLNDVLIWDDRIFVTERESGDVIALEGGQVADRVRTGSDSFALARHEDLLLVTNRQGADLPKSGAYEGAPGLVSALSYELEPIWSAEVGKTCHFLTWDGQWWWTANEDSLDLSAIDPETGQEALRGPVLGLTADHLAHQDGSLLVPSHLTDEVWRVELDAGQAQVVQSCGWPLVTSILEDTQLDAEVAWAVCQETGEVQGLDPVTLDSLASEQLASTFHPSCGDGLCTGHDVLADVTVHADELVVADPALPGLRWRNGDTATISMQSQRVDDLQHFQVEPLDGALLLYEPRAQLVYRIVDGEVQDAVKVSARGISFPLVPDGDRIWVGSQALSADLQVVAEIDQEDAAMAAGGRWLVAQREWELLVYDRDSLEVVERKDMNGLQGPPFVFSSENLASPLRYVVLDGDVLAVANLFRATIERWQLPDVILVGEEDVVQPMGHWAHLEGLR